MCSSSAGEYVSDPTYLTKEYSSDISIAKADGITRSIAMYESIKNIKTEIRDFIDYPINVVSEQIILYHIFPSHTTFTAGYYLRIIDYSKGYDIMITLRSFAVLRMTLLPVILKE